MKLTGSLPESLNNFTKALDNNSASRIYTCSLPKGMCVVDKTRQTCTTRKGGYDVMVDQCQPTTFVWDAGLIVGLVVCALFLLAALRCLMVRSSGKTKVAGLASV